MMKITFISQSSPFIFFLLLTSLTNTLSSFIPTPSKKYKGTPNKTQTNLKKKDIIWGTILSAFKKENTDGTRGNTNDSDTISCTEDDNNDGEPLLNNAYKFHDYDMIRLLDMDNFKTLLTEEENNIMQTINLQNELDGEITIINPLLSIVNNNHLAQNNEVKTSSSLSSMSNKNKNKKPLKIIIAGAPASGKGTQCEKIKEIYGLVHLSTGDMLRNAVKSKTKIGMIAKEYMDNGKLVPDELIINIVKERIQENDCKTQGWLLDGFPRTYAQAKALSSMGINPNCFLYLNVPDSQIIDRVTGRRIDPISNKIYHLIYNPPPFNVEANLIHRSDDTKQKIMVRLKQFHDNFNSVKECYEDILIEIDGDRRPEDVLLSISNALEEESYNRDIVLA